MLFKSIAKDVTDQMYIDANLKAAQDRKNEVVKRLSLYHDQMEDYVNIDLAKHHNDPDVLTPTYFNLVKKLCNNLAMAYLSNPTREVVGTKRDQQIYQHIIESSKLDVKMKVVSRYAKLLKTLLIRPIWRDGKIELDVLTGDILDILTANTVEKLERVMITNYPQSGKQNDINYSVWDKDIFRRLDHNGNEIEVEENPYKLLPFIPIWDSWPCAGTFWMPGGDDLINCQEAVNARLTELQLTLRYQAFGVAVSKGMSDGTVREVGPNSVIEIQDPEGSFEYKKTHSPIAAMLEAIEFLSKNLAITNGLPAQSMSIKATQESGLAKISGNRELEESRRDQLSLFSTFEKELFTMNKIIWNYHNPNRKLSEESRLKIDFADPKPVLDPLKQVESFEKELNMGTKSRTDILMIQNPDLSKEDAQVKLQEIIDENKQFNNSPDEALNTEE